MRGKHMPLRIRPTVRQMCINRYGCGGLFSFWAGHGVAEITFDVYTIHSSTTAIGGAGLPCDGLAAHLPVQGVETGNASLSPDPLSAQSARPRQLLKGCGHGLKRRVVP